MNDDAAYYQDHKDDEREWEEVPRPARRSESRRLKTMVSVRFSPDEAEYVRAEAEAAGLTLSAFIRQVALAVTGPSTAAGWRAPTRTGIGQTTASVNTASFTSQLGRSPIVIFDSGGSETTTVSAA